MRLVDGISHVATMTEDLDRLAAFYRRVFDAETSEVMEENGLRHQLIFLGDQVALHPFEVPGKPLDSSFEMFEHGRLDHFGVTAPSVDAFLEIRDRLRRENGGAAATDERVIDFGMLYSLPYVDPDGVQLEVNLFKDEGTVRELHGRGVETRPFPVEPAGV